MKKYLLPLAIVSALFLAGTAQAQVNLIRMGFNGATIAKRLSNKQAAAPPDAAAPTSVKAASATYDGQTFPMVRTASDQLPKKGAAQVVAIEAELERCHAALLASPTGAVCPPEQRTAIQQAVVNLARVQPNSNLAAYQQEATFYLAEDARRQQAAPAPTPAK